MKVGDLVTMPGSCYRDNRDTPAMGVVVSTECDAKVHGFRAIGETTRPLIERVQVHWIDDAETTWEPVKWLEVVSEGR